MPNPEELERKFWKALKSDRTVMLGLDGVEDGHTRPMTAQIEGGAGGPIWFFASTDNKLVQKLSGADRAILSFASKGHDLFATVHGSIRLDNDPAVIDRLWNPFIAAWYDGKGDPRLALLRVDPEQGEVWEDASDLLAGVKMMLGLDPKKDYADNTAEVNLR